MTTTDMDTLSAEGGADAAASSPPDPSWREDLEPYVDVALDNGLYALGFIVLCGFGGWLSAVAGAIVMVLAVGVMALVSIGLARRARRRQRRVERAEAPRS